MKVMSDKETQLGTVDKLERVVDRLRAVASTLPGRHALEREIADIEKAATNVRAVAEGWPIDSEGRRLRPPLLEVVLMAPVSQHRSRGLVLGGNLCEFKKNNR